MTVVARGDNASNVTIINGPVSPTQAFWVNGKWSVASNYGVTVATQGLHYGTGVFEGIRGYWSSTDRCVYVLRLADHIDRFLTSCQLLRIDPKHAAAELCELVLDVVARNGIQQDVYIRPIAFKSKLMPGTPFGVGLTGVEDTVAIYATPMPSKKEIEGIRCCISAWRRVPGDCIPARAKVTGSYANIALAVDEARSAGYDDAILLNTRGTVAEASTSNVFVVARGRIATPSVGCDILAGVTRACVLELASDLGLQCEERPVTMAELFIADEVFTTGTGSELTAVVEINGRPVGLGAPGAVSKALFDRYRGCVVREVDSHLPWTTAVKARRTNLSDY